MRIVASDFYTLHSPSRCELRVYLAHHGVQGSPSGPFEQVLFRLGDRHEATHLAALGDHVDLRGGTLEVREKRSREAVAGGARILYQPILRCEVEIAELICEVVGEPDFLIREGEGYVVRDSKLLINEIIHLRRVLPEGQRSTDQRAGQPPDYDKWRSASTNPLAGPVDLAEL